MSLCNIYHDVETRGKKKRRNQLCGPLQMVEICFVIWQAEVENLSLEERRLDDRIRLWFINFLESVVYHHFRFCNLKTIGYV